MSEKPTEPTTENQSGECDLDAWSNRLENSLSRIKSDPNSKWAWTYDMDDQPEISDPELEKFPQLKTALQFFQERLHPVWKSADERAVRFESTRRWVAAFAIWPGIVAILLAIFRLVLPSVPGLTNLAELVTALEVLSVILAGIAVTMGVLLHYHHRWLANRQHAELLRGLKFQSLGWHELWCDHSEWKGRIEKQLSALENLSVKDAEEWAAAKDDAFPNRVIDPECDVDPGELKALATYYQNKRLKFQKAYFEWQANQANLGSWAARWKVSLVVLFTSVGVVLLHGLLAIILRATGGEAEHANEHVGTFGVLEILLIGLAGILPVLGFGIRAWASAFEYPRSRNLFRAKSNALVEPIESILEHSNDLVRTMRCISQSEHFFEGEHREWCRLQVESEWFV